jgi:hypothetical protein
VLSLLALLVQNYLLAVLVQKYHKKAERGNEA